MKSRYIIPDTSVLGIEIESAILSESTDDGTLKVISYDPSTGGKAD